MNKAKTFLKLITSDKIIPVPFIMLAILAGLVIASYLLAGWMMRPIGDDYNSIVAYHLDASWWRILPETVIDGGGRYGQTFVSVSWYGALGQTGLKLTAFVAVGLFLLAGYLAILAWQKTKGMALNHKFAALGAAIFFMLYSLISITFPWIRGNIDNSFQNFLWLPGFITYSLPLGLLAVLAASAILIPQITQLKKKWLIALGILAIFTGTFSEIIPVIYTELLAIIAIYQLATHRFKLRTFIKKRVRSYIPFLTIEAGMLVGLACNYLSPATSQRRALFDQPSLTDIIHQSMLSSKQYFATYVFGDTAADRTELLFTVIVSVALGLLVFKLYKLKTTWKTVKQLALVNGLLVVMTISSVFISFAVLFKGYGISPYTYLLPRFEIIYNIWFTLLLIFVGILLAAVLSVVARQHRATKFVPIACLLISFYVVASVPNILNVTTHRLQSVAVFSNNWKVQDDLLRYEAAQGVEDIDIPVVDIGDAFNFGCDGNVANHWLGDIKQEYYDIDKICALPE